MTFGLMVIKCVFYCNFVYIPNPSTCLICSMDDDRQENFINFRLYGCKSIKLILLKFIWSLSDSGQTIKAGCTSLKTQVYVVE